MWFIIVLLIVGATGKLPCPYLCSCDYDNLHLVDCRFGEHSQIPDGIDTNITTLDLSFNNFTYIPHTLGRFTNLKYLNLSNNKISALKHTDFQGLINLEVLDLQHNSFSDSTDVKSGSLTNLINLKFLDFSYNPIRTVPKLLINSLNVLRFVNASIIRIDSNILDNLPNLIELHLSQNLIMYLNSGLSSNKVKFIDLSLNNLRHIDSTAFTNLTKLETLYLNKAKRLRSLQIFSDSLLYLDLSDCNLETIPSGNIKKVYDLNLQGNYLKTLLKDSFAAFFDLKFLNLSYNVITSIDILAFRTLQNIITIDLSKNTLYTINSDLFTSNKALQYLNLSRNYINIIDQLTSPSLRYLDVSYCEIFNLEEYSLSNMPNLETLKLSRNYISVLPNSLIATKLVNLDLSNCRIRTINNRTFERMISLRNLNLGGNQLNTINPNYFPQVQYLDISNNAWRCECDKLKEMYDWFTLNGMRPNLLCDTPEQVQGKTWIQACSNEWHPNTAESDSLWWYSVGVVVIMVILLFALLVMRKMHNLKEQRLTLERQRRDEEREALRRMERLQREVEQQENRNAPDPREDQRPPSYHEALLLPPIDSSHPNLAGSLHSLTSSNPELSKSGKPRRKRRRRRLSASSESQRASRATIDTENSEPEMSTVPRVALESDF